MDIILMKMCRCLYVFICLLFFVNGVIAQEERNVAKEEYLHWLKSFDFERPMRCVLDSLGEHSIQYYINEADQKSISMHKIEWISYRKKGRQTRYSLVGGVIGGVAGLLFWSKYGRRDDIQLQSQILSGGIGAGIGTLFGIAMGARKRRIYIQGVNTLSPIQKDQIILIIK